MFVTSMRWGPKTARRKDMQVVTFAGLRVLWLLMRSQTAVDIGYPEAKYRKKRKNESFKQRGYALPEGMGKVFHELLMRLETGDRSDVRTC
jgi:hypothetical protein